MSARRKSRRQFLEASAVLGVGVWSSRTALAQTKSPNEKVQFASIGVGGKGDSDSGDAAGHGELIAICDIDEKQLERKGKAVPKAAKYYDFRKMLEDMGDKIDAVTVSTADHTHAVASAMAMRMGKHVYCQKPLTWSIHEAKVLRDLAAEKKVVTQMGNQGTSHDGFRQGVEILRSGALGPVKEIHCWTNRPIWPQGFSLPTTNPGIPNNLHWYEFLGPAPDRPYHRDISPFKWRGWLDYGTGALGDMACHTLNVAFHGLDLVDPTGAEVVATSGIVGDSFPKWSVIKTSFGARGSRGPLDLIWYDGGGMLPNDKKVPAALLHGEKRSDSGLLIVGEKGSFYSQNDYGAAHVLLPKKSFIDFKAPSPTLPRVGGDHFGEFVRAIKENKPDMPMSNFGPASRLTESILLGVVALRTGKKIEWDAAKQKAVGCPEADQYISREYRKGWTL
jgi:predicted dehydrogenase